MVNQIMPIRTKVIAVLVAVLILATTLAGTGNQASAKLKGKKPNGEQLFAGLILGQGEFAKEFDTVWTKDMLEKANTPEAQKDAKLILKEMKKVDKGYFGKLEKAVYEKDLYGVYNTLVIGGDVLNQALENLGAGVVNPDDSISTNCLTTTFAGLATAVLVLVVTGAALANTYWVYNYTVLKTKSSIVEPGSMSIDQEMFTKTMIEKVVNYQ
ncbi:hypothetical protein [Bacillus sp. REN3]|uniref:hypothetical protein n=1 Tax=Bacillus sp. REN3 TaxID=2802440 RepID=UPI001AEE6A56|nr:hypothetical protein [Bacillus sp. REN3]